MRLVLAIAVLAAISMPLHADDESRPYLDDTEGRYRLEVLTPRTRVTARDSLTTTFCLSTATGERVEVCLGRMAGIQTWAAGDGTTTIVLPPSDPSPCTCERIVRLSPETPFCWPMTLGVPALRGGWLDLAGFSTVLEEAREPDATSPTCVRVRSNIIRLTIDPDTSDEEPLDEPPPDPSPDTGSRD